MFKAESQMAVLVLVFNTIQNRCSVHYNHKNVSISVFQLCTVESDGPFLNSCKHQPLFCTAQTLLPYNVNFTEILFFDIVYALLGDVTDLTLVSCHFSLFPVSDATINVFGKFTRSFPPILRTNPAPYAD